MARRSQIRYFASRGAYYSQINGRQHLLAKGPDDFPDGPTYKAASHAFWQLLEKGKVTEAGDNNTLRVLCETWLEATEAGVSPGTLGNRLTLLTPFIEIEGETPAGQLSFYKVEQFLASMQRPHPVQRFRRGGARVEMSTWGVSRCRDFLGALKGCLNWAVKRALISKNPILEWKLPASRSAAQDCILTPQQHARLLQLARPALRRLLIALENTGARPSELFAATADAWDDARGALYYPAETHRKAGQHRHKAARYKARTIFFTGEALEMMRQLVRQYPSGPLFRRNDGRPFSARQTLNTHFSRLAERAGIPGLVPYSYRHTLATRWLMAGKSIEILAEILGNTPQVIRKHYAHLCNDWHGVRAHLEDFRRAE